MLGHGLSAERALEIADVYRSSRRKARGGRYNRKGTLADKTQLQLLSPIALPVIIEEADDADEEDSQTEREGECTGTRSAEVAEDICINVDIGGNLVRPLPEQRALASSDAEVMGPDARAIEAVDFACCCCGWWRR